MALQIVKVQGINGLGITDGCELAGNMILNELKNIYSNEQGSIIDVDLLDFEEIHLDNGNLELTNKLIYENALESFNKDRVIFLGGDHSISYSLIKAFGKLSKVPILINTSFNIRGEPIVCSPYDAYKCMMGTGIDYLVMDKFLIKREDNLRDKWDSEKYAKD